MHYAILIAAAALICAGLLALAWRRSLDCDREIAPTVPTMRCEPMADPDAALDDREGAAEPSADDPVPGLGAQMAPGCAATRAVECSPAPGPPPPSSGPSLTILLVEDNRLNEDLALRMLERLGYSADVAHNGLEALEALRGRCYDVVLMDLHMPQLDGLEACRRIRAELPPARQPRIIAMTANTLSGISELCLAAGMDGYLSKPISTQALQRTLAGGQLAAPPAARPALPQAADLATWDPGPLRRIAENLGPAANVLLRDLVGGFFEEANHLLPELAGHLAAGDMVTLHRYAHILKSHGATFGGLSFEALCRELERAAAANDFERAAWLIPRVEAEFVQLRAALIRVQPSEG